MMWMKKRQRTVPCIFIIFMGVKNERKAKFIIAKK